MPEDKRTKISIGCRSYNEEGNIRKAYDEIKKVAESLPQYDYEIVFADNCSTDKTPEILRSIAAEDKEHVRVILNAANFGVERSEINLEDNITGDVYIIVPADLQEPIEMLPEFMKYWEEGYLVVWGQKTQSDESKIKYACRKLYYNIIDHFSDVKQYHQVDCFGITDKRVLDIVKETRKQDPEYNLRNLVAEYGFKIKLIPYKQRAREWGKSSYGIGKYYDFAVSSLCNTSIKPLHILTAVGLIIGVLSIVVGIIYLIYKLTHWYDFNVGIAPMVIILSFTSGIQLFSIGILGEYISIILRKVTKKPQVVEAERINFDNTIE